MKRSLAIALAVFALVAASRTASAQAGPAQCNNFLRLRGEAEQKATAVRTAMARKVDRKEICALVQHFAAAEGTMVKFLEDNKTWCGIPDMAIKQAKASHEKTLKFRTAACSEAPAAQPRPPSLSDAIGAPAVDTAGNTKMGHGTFDTLNGNPLAK